MRDEQDAFYDLCYEAWRSGKNPDAISEDRYDDLLAQGYYPDEISLKDVYPKRRSDDERTLP